MEREMEGEEERGGGRGKGGCQTTWPEYSSQALRCHFNWCHNLVNSAAP